MTNEASPKPKSVLDPHDQRNIDALKEKLDELDISKNKVQSREFAKFTPLFTADASTHLDRDEIISLSKEFVSRFNVYRPIEVYDGEEYLFTIPQLFIPIADISVEYSRLVDRFRKDGTSGIPRHAALATRGLLLALLKSQKDTITKHHGSVKEYIAKLAEQYADDANSVKRMRERFDQKEPSAMDLIDSLLVESDDTTTTRSTSKSETTATVTDSNVSDLGLVWD